jgi:glycine/D-amino acid oxidase-like deaminating enzyme
VPVNVDIAIVGAGPIGSAVARYCVGASIERVVLVGPDEPSNYLGHRGPFAGHYESSRTWSVLQREPVAAILAARSRTRFEQLRHVSGVTFFRPCLYAVGAPEAINPGGNADNPQYRYLTNFMELDRMARNAAGVGFTIERALGEDLMREYPQLKIPRDHRVLIERDALVLNARSLVEAQRVAAGLGGCARFKEEVIGIKPKLNHVELVLASETKLRAETLILCTGGSTNAYGFLPKTLNVITNGSHVFLVECAQSESSEVPNFLGLVAGPDEPGEIYLVGVNPPTRYPDGRYYVKFSCKQLSRASNELKSRDEIADWFHSSVPAAGLETARRMLGGIFPLLSGAGLHFQPCLMEYPAESHFEAAPMIDRIGDHMYLACGTWGYGLMASDEIGRLTADLAITGTWDDSFDREMFRARFK